MKWSNLDSLDGENINELVEESNGEQNESIINYVFEGNNKVNDEINCIELEHDYI